MPRFHAAPTPSPGQRPLLIGAALEAHLAATVRRARPLEACGLLVGAEDHRGLRLARAPECRNLAAAHAQARRPGPRRLGAPPAPWAPGADRFELHPEDHLAAARAARADGLEVLGVWHSHPHGPPRPSRRDREGAWHGSIWLIGAFDARGRVVFRAWTPGEGADSVEGFLPLPLQAGPT